VRAGELAEPTAMTALQDVRSDSHYLSCGFLIGLSASAAPTLNDLTFLERHLRYRNGNRLPSFERECLRVTSGSALDDRSCHGVQSRNAGPTRGGLTGSDGLGLCLIG